LVFGSISRQKKVAITATRYIHRRIIVLPTIRSIIPYFNNISQAKYCLF
jgi:hypothetical protein